jgi:transcriptional regulator with XRE-family HTH domain
LTRDELGERIGVVGETIGRYERGEWKNPLEPRTLSAIATATGVPDWFLTDGFERPHEEPAVVERVEALENRYKALENRIAEIIERELATALAASTTGRASGKGTPGLGHGPEYRGGSRL